MITFAIGTDVSKVSVGSVTGIGVGVGEGTPAEALPIISNEAVRASVILFQLV